jgi:hypothetical protein
MSGHSSSLNSHARVTLSTVLLRSISTPRPRSSKQRLRSAKQQAASLKLHAAREQGGGM